MKDKSGSCEYCMYYTFDEDYGYYICEKNLDEDEMMRFLSGNSQGCSHFQYGDEYRIVRKQM